MTEVIGLEEFQEVVIENLEHFVKKWILLESANCVGYEYEDYSEYTYKDWLERFIYEQC